MRLGYLLGILILAGVAYGVDNPITLLTWDFKEGTPDPWRTRGIQLTKGKEPGLRGTTANDPALWIDNGFIVPGGENVRVRMAVSKGKTAQLFWGSMPHEADSMRIPLTTDGKIHEYSFRAPYDLVGRLRFDPTEERTSFHIESIVVPTIPSRTVLARALYWDHRTLHASRKERLSLVLQNTGKKAAQVSAHLVTPYDGLILHSPATQRVTLAPAAKLARIPKSKTYDILETTWLVEAKKPMEGEIKVRVERNPGSSSELVIAGLFNKAIAFEEADHVPLPVPAKTEYIIGAHYFSGWKVGTHFGWTRIAPYPDRKPLLGWYDEGSPEVTDWEIKWAVEHGISFFLYSWYRVRGNEGKTVKFRIGHAIHEGLLKAKYRDKFKFCIMYENQGGGISGLDDLMKNLLPFWMDNYFTHPSYLKIDNKPVLALYNLDKFHRQLGNTSENVRKAVEQMNEAFRKKGFDGVWLLSAGGIPKLKDLKINGFDYVFDYSRANSSTERLNKELLLIPTVSMGNNKEPWGRGKGGQRLSPGQFRAQCVKTKALMDKLPKEHLGRRVLLLDNWNEWGEGHYIAPHRQYGFGYLDAVREVFTDAPGEHVDVVPEDVGLGPYESLYRNAIGPQVRNR